MLEDFVRLVQELFPSIQPGSAERCIATIRQYDQQRASFALAPVGADLAQGDILGPLTILQTDDDGESARLDGPVMLLSQTCDAENDDSVIVCASHPLAEFAADGRFAAIESNVVYQFMVIRNVPDVGDTVFDLAAVHAISRRFLQREIEARTVQRYASLSQVGYWFLLAKLTVHFLRPEKPGDVDRAVPPA